MSSGTPLGESPAASRWLAAGVRQQILMRILPVFRHELAGPLSIARMGALLLKRQSSAGTVAGDTVGERATMLDQQLELLIGNIRALRCWDAEARDAVALGAGLEGCVALLMPLLSMRDVQFEVDKALSASTVRVMHSQLFYMVLGAACHLLDGPEALDSIALRPDGGTGLTAAGTTRAQPNNSSAMEFAPPALPISAAALQQLGSDFGWQATLEQTTVRLKFPEPMAAASAG